MRKRYTAKFNVKVAFKTIIGQGTSDSSRSPSQYKNRASESGAANEHEARPDSQRLLLFDGDEGLVRAIRQQIITRLWWIVTYEKVLLKEYATPFDARDNRGAYFYSHDTERQHSSLGTEPQATVY